MCPIDCTKILILKKGQQSTVPGIFEGVFKGFQACSVFGEVGELVLHSCAHCPTYLGDPAAVEAAQPLLVSACAGL